MMSSEISTDAARSAAQAAAPAQSGMQPWQFFVLAGLGCATAITFVLRGQGIAVVVLVSLMMATAALVGIAVLRTIAPLVSATEDRAVFIGRRTRAALEQEKALALRTIKELEFDRAMGKISDDDFRDMSVRLRARAARLMKQLDAGTGYRAQIERDLTKRLAQAPEVKAPGHNSSHACPKCSTSNDGDARFCKNCGERLA